MNIDWIRLDLPIDTNIATRAMGVLVARPTGRGWAGVGTYSETQCFVHISTCKGWDCTRDRQIGAHLTKAVYDAVYVKPSDEICEKR